MSEASIVLVGGRELAERFDRLGPAVRAALVPVMARLMVGLEAYVRRDKLSGQVLKNRTGHLRNSVTHAVAEDATGVTGRVGIFAGPTIAYGAVHEFGWSGPVTIREHVRTIKQAFGKPIAPVQATVHAYSRRSVTFPERSFLRAALEDKRAALSAQLRASVLRLVTAAPGATG